MNRRFVFKSLSAAFAWVLFAVSVAGQAAGDPVSVIGQVVCCLDCWQEKDRSKVEYGSSEDLLKAIGCVEGGDPTMLAVRENEGFKLYVLKEGKFRLPGENWIEYIGKTVTIEGRSEKAEKHEHLVVDGLEVVKESLAAREAKEVLGKTIPLRLADLSGSLQDLSLFKGRVVVLNFWATFCEPCRKEMPDLAEIQSEFAPFGVQVIGANADAQEDRAKVLKFIREAKVNFPIWMNSSTADMVRFGLGVALPGTVLIDKQGRVSKVISGVVDPEKLREDIDELLAMPTEAVATGPESGTGSDPMASNERSLASSVPS
ncbi:MAG: TlpA family protein disulfide reductase [Acidobacteria bacterium]|nr:MAG: TlpA family protein disulfide reductase [Acidobacteriota bacterium]REK01333.1 MAG: TlpA family protein disulfide reductase [Acidobacteriota bacterium]REK14289.1 MAG: TlpA family protein disulfide reductase [Acidobacteriota bacterium]REK45004.1 MAG: TlpA family protein disulfide reductase [Acidobacteriota bacterium]